MKRYALTSAEVSLHPSWGTLPQVGGFLAHDGLVLPQVGLVPPPTVGAVAQVGGFLAQVGGKLPPVRLILPQVGLRLPLVKYFFVQSVPEKNRGIALLLVI